MGFETGSPTYGLRDGKIGLWNGDGTYGTPQDIFAIRILGAKLTTSSADLEGDDTILATQTTIQKAEITLEFGAVQFDVIQILSGVDKLQGADYYRQMVSTKNPQYIGLAGQAIAAENGGDTHLFIPKCKATSGFEVRFERDAFSIPQITLTAVADDNFHDADGYPLIFVMDQHVSVTSISLPPTGLVVG